MKFRNMFSEIFVETSGNKLLLLLYGKRKINFKNKSNLSSDK